MGGPIYLISEHETLKTILKTYINNILKPRIKMYSWCIMMTVSY